MDAEATSEVRILLGAFGDVYMIESSYLRAECKCGCLLEARIPKADVKKPEWIRSVDKVEQECVVCGNKHVHVLPEYLPMAKRRAQIQLEKDLKHVEERIKKSEDIDPDELTETGMLLYEADQMLRSILVRQRERAFENWYLPEAKREMEDEWRDEFGAQVISKEAMRG